MNFLFDCTNVSERAANARVRARVDALTKALSLNAFLL